MFLKSALKAVKNCIIYFSKLAFGQILEWPYIFTNTDQIILYDLLIFKPSQRIKKMMLEYIYFITLLNFFQKLLQF